jgi:hypothetical protein
MDLRKKDLDDLKQLAEIWKTTPGSEFEAMLTGVELTAWQDVIQYLRSLGMRENPQIVRMNICLSNDIRFTLEGAGVIQAYCRDNRIRDKPFTAMLKEALNDAEPVTLESYGAKAKLKRELPLAQDDDRVVDAIKRWEQLGKHFRMIQRFEFIAPGSIPLRFDISVVRENAGRPARTFQEARVTALPAHYEAEVELLARRDNTTAEAAMHSVIRGLGWLLQGRQRSYALVTNQRAEAVRNEIASIFGFGGSGSNGNRNRNRNRAGPTPTFRFPGPQPATLERRHIAPEPEAGVPNLRFTVGGYNVTDKADGLRCLLYVSDIGRIYLIDGGGRVYATGKEVDASNAGLVLDGEWIRRDRKGTSVSHYYAFDILATKGGISSIASQPFMVAGAAIGSKAMEGTRMAAMNTAVSVLVSAKQMIKGTPASQNIQIGMKRFRAAEGDAIFRDGAAATLEDMEAQTAIYNTDGLIFTPNTAPLPLGGGTWTEQLKWKPPHENTIDFLVIVEREREVKSGEPLATEAIGTKYREDSGQTVRYKTLRLFVGGTRDLAFADPRRTVLNNEPLPTSMDSGEWREVEFRPTDPRDPMASTCYVGINEGSTDPAASSNASQTLDLAQDLIRCQTTGDIIQSDMIVEMAYFPERAPGWRWVPMRVRHDKTERWLIQQSKVGGRKGGTMNADWVASSIWTTIHNPVTRDAVASGKVVQCAAPTTVTASGISRRAPARDLMKVQCMINFHNDVIKRNMLLRPLLRGATLCDLGMGNGEDIPKWISGGASFVFGCDLKADALNSPEYGAYRVLLDKMITLGGRDRVPPMAFAQADMARRLSTGEAAMSDEDRSVLAQVFGPSGAGTFDVVSCMFAIQYMFSDENTLAGFLGNLADTIKVGGYFVGCAADGDAIARMFAAADGEPTISGRDGRAEIWQMTKRYGSAVGSNVPPSAAGLGLAVDVDFMANGMTYTQYLVSWPYLQSKLSECGLELLTADELTAMRLPASTQMFGDTWTLAEGAGDVYAMSDAVRRLSFLNRWWIFKRVSDRRPAPPRGVVSGAKAVLTEMKPAELESTSNAAPTFMSAIPEGNEGEVSEKIDLGEVDVGPKVTEESKDYIVDPAIRTGDGRLGAEMADWSRYLSLGIPVELVDIADPTVVYPSIEAAIASAKYQLSTNLPKKGPELFNKMGSIHQKAEAARATLRSTGATQEAIDKSYDDEVTDIRLQSGKNKITKSYKGEWNVDAWNAQKEGVYRAYLKQRYLKDERFKAMIDAIKAKGGQVLYANGTSAENEMGVGVVDGKSVGGQNRIGSWMMEVSS